MKRYITEPNSEGYAGENQPIGLTKREYFAIMNLQGMLSNPRDDAIKSEMVLRSIEYADNLIDKLNEDA